MLEVLYVDVVWSCRVVVLAVFDCCFDFLSCDVYLGWMQSQYFPCYFPVCGVSFVRNGVNELFVEGTCNVLWLMWVLFLNVMELLSWSFVC